MLYCRYCLLVMFISLLVFSASSQEKFYERKSLPENKNKPAPFNPAANEISKRIKQERPQAKPQKSRDEQPKVKEETSGQSNVTEEKLEGRYGQGDYRLDKQVKELIKKDPSKRKEILKEYRGIVPVNLRDSENKKPAGSHLPAVVPQAPIEASTPNLTQQHARRAQTKLPPPPTGAEQTLGVAADDADSLILVDLYYATNGDQWYDNTNWLSAPLDTWYGVTLSEGKVVGLSLDYNEMEGTLPDLSGLTALTYLSMSGNALKGELPQSIGQMENLQYINMENNQLVGTIPDLTALTQLEQILLSYNNFSGDFPDAPSLVEIIRINDNNFESIPDFSGYPNLYTLQVYNNYLTFDDIQPNDVIEVFYFSPQKPLIQVREATGAVDYTWNLEIDPEISDSYYIYTQDQEVLDEGTNLRSLNISQAGMYECTITNSAVPDLSLTARLFVGETVSEADSLALAAFYSATEGRYWYENTNWLEGPVSSWYGVEVENGRVTELHLAYNGVTGQIPESFYSLDALKVLDLSGNWIYSSLSSSISNLTSLEYLILRDLGLSGNIPPEIANCTNLKVLDLYGNAFMGTIPEDLFALDLSYFDVSWNNLNGTISESIGNFTNLEHLGLSGNYFTGQLPSSVGNLERLKVLWMGTSSIVQQSGIPEVIQNLDSLESVNFQMNGLTALPGFLFDKESLRELILDSNDFSEITQDLFEQLAMLPALESVYLDNTRLSGALPDVINEIGSLLILQLNSNNLDELPVLQNEQTQFFLNNNRLTFEDLEKQTIVPYTNFDAGYQQQASENEDIFLFPGQARVLDVSGAGGQSGSYQWYHNGMLLDGEYSPTLTLNASSANGDYYCIISHSLISETYGLVLYSGNYSLSIVEPVIEADSLALVTFYQENNGVNWTNQENWLTGPVASWEGIEVQQGRVIELWIDSNQINGALSPAISQLDALTVLNIQYGGITSLPAELGNLSSLTELSFYGNKLTEIPFDASGMENLMRVDLSYNKMSVFPDQLLGFSQLSEFYLYDNEIESLPDLSDFGYIYIDIADNRLDFEDLEPYVTSENIYFYSQKPFTSNQFINVEVGGEEVTLSVEVGGSANAYQWMMNGQVLEGENAPTLTINVSQSTFFNCVVTSDVLPDVMLISGVFYVSPASDVVIDAPALYYNYGSEYYGDGQNYIEEQGLAVSDLSGDNFSILSNFISSYFTDIDPVNKKIFLTGDFEESQAIMSMDLNGGNLQVVFQREFTELEGLAVDYHNGHIYYTEGCCSDGGSYIYRVNMDGSEDQVIVTGLDDPVELEIDLVNGKLYWSDLDEGMAILMRSNLDGSDVEVLHEIPWYGGGLNVDPEHNALFWIQMGQDEREHLMKSPAEGGNATTVPLPTTFYSSFAPVTRDQKIYYLAYNSESSSALYSINYDGSENQFVAELPIQYAQSMFAYEGVAQPINTSDSLALVAFYQEMNGADWVNASNWLTDDVASWYGVSVRGSRVIGVNLEENNLTGNFSAGLLALSELTSLSGLSLRGNQLEGSIPSAIGELNELVSLDLSDNQLIGEIPSALGSLTNLVTLSLNKNALIGAIPAALGDLVSLEKMDLSGNELEGQIPPTLANLTALESLDLSHNSFYVEIAPELGAISSLQELSLSHNMFFGSIPEAFSELQSLRVLDLSHNQLEGTVAPLANLSSLTHLIIAENRFVDLPDFSQSNVELISAEKNYFDFADFELNSTLIANEVLNVFPQDSLYGRSDTLHDVGVDIEFSFPLLRGTSNTYQWLFNGAPLENQTASTLTIVAPDTPVEGEYILQVQSGLFPGEMLVTAPVTLKLSSLERDKATLLAFIGAVDKNGKYNPQNWSASNELDNSWEGVTVEADRVVALELPAVIDNDLSDGDQSRILEGNVPGSFADLTGLQTLNLAGNSLSRFVNISKWPSLAVVDIRQNRLSFSDLIPNMKLAERESVDFLYAPQKRHGSTLIDTVQAGSDVVVATSLDFPGTEYKWSFGPLIPGRPFNNDVEPIAGATSRRYLIENVDFSKQGTYRVAMTHPDVPGLTIESFNRNIWASTDLFGRVILDSNDGTPLSNGEVIIYRIKEGPYAGEDTVMVSPDGHYVFENLVLGDFIVLVKPERPSNPQPGDVVPVQTYFEETEFDSAATVVNVRERIEGVDIQLVTYTIPEKDPIGATIIGLIESEFEEDAIEDEEAARVEARRKVKKAGCSMRRRTRGGGGRTGQDESEYELFAYVESDDEGYFDFTGIPAGTYLLNIQYPGIPMDATSDIEFVIGEDVQEQKFEVIALIEATGITVVTEEVLSVAKPYIKDLKLYPNPTADVLRVDYLVNRKISDLKLSVLTVKGDELLTMELDSRMGAQSVKVDFSGYDAGMYFLLFTDEAGTFKHQVKVGKK